MIQPYSIEAESSVLGSMILSQKAVAEMLEVLKPEDFYRPAHQIVFNAIAKLASKGKEVDLVTLRAQLADMDQLTNVGGIDYLIILAEFVPSAANVEDYAQIVLSRKKRRDLLALAEMAKNLAQNEEDVEKALERIGEQAAKIDGADDDFRFESVKQLTREIIDVVDDGMAGVVASPYVSSGYVALDEFLGGYRPGGVYVVGGRTSMGKTAMAVSSAIRVAQRGTPVLVVTLEMPAIELTRRCMAIIGGFPAWWLDGKTTDPAKYEKISDSAEALHGLPIEFASSSMTFFIDDLRKALNRMKSRHGQGGVVLVDYVQLMDGKGRDSRAEQLNVICKQFKHLCKRFHVSGLLLSQVNQRVDKQENKVPDLSDFSDSSAITKAADVVMAIHRQEYYDARKDKRKEEKVSLAEIHILKNRQGEVGMAELWFQKLNTAFIDKRDP